MTESTYLVSVSPEETAALMRQLDEVIGEVDGDDPKVRKRVGILDAGAALFMRQGYRKTSMEQVAKEAGVAKGTVYLYFAKKIDLLLAAIGREKKFFLRELMDVFDDTIPVAQRLRRYCVAVLLSGIKMPLAGRVFQGEDMAAILKDMPPALIAQGEANRDAVLVPMIRELVGEHRFTDSELRDRAKVLVGLGMFSPMIGNELFPKTSGMSPQRYAEILADLIVAGLSRKDSTP